MALSAGERYVFYATIRNRSELSQCNPGGDAAVCDLAAVASLDLTTGASSQTVLPQGCGYPVLHAGSANMVVAACTNMGYVQEMDAQGHVLAHDDFGARALFGFVLSDGRLGAVLRDGTVPLRNQDQSVTRIDTLQTRGAVVSPTDQTFDLGNNRLLIPYTFGNVVGSPVGFVVVNVVTQRVEHRVAPTTAVSVVPRGSSQLLLLSRGAIHTYDLGTASTAEVAYHPVTNQTAAEVLVP